MSSHGISVAVQDGHRTPSPSGTADERALRARGADPASVSIVIPCYNEEDVLPFLESRLREVLQQLTIPCEVVLVDDGSSDLTWDMMKEIAARDPHYRCLRLSRNFGHQRALTCGIDHARGEVMVIMDADLQDPPELLGPMIGKWREGFDVVYGKRRQRHGESLAKRGFAFLFYRLFRRITSVPIPLDVGDFRLMDYRAVQAIRALPETHRYIRGMVAWVGFPQTAVEYDRKERISGQSKYSFKKSFMLAVDGVISFSVMPRRLGLYLGVPMLGAAAVMIFFVLLDLILGNPIRTGFGIATALITLQALQFLLLGVLGEYLGRTFEQTQGRPHYIVEHSAGLPRMPELARTGTL